MFTRSAMRVARHSAMILAASRSPQMNVAREYHASVLIYGRKSGAGAFDVDFRELSRKQKRRKARLTELRALSKDPKKEKLRAAFLKKQFESPEMKAFADKTSKMLSETLQELMLPDGLSSAMNDNSKLVRLPEAITSPTETLLQLQMWISNLEDKSKATAFPALGAGPDQSTVGKALATYDPSVLPVTLLAANRALAHFVEQGSQGIDDAEETLLLMQAAGIAAQPAVFASCMARLSRAGQHARAEELFDRMVNLGIEPDAILWSALVHAQARGAGSDAPDRALRTLDRVKQFGLATAPMYTSVLRAFVVARRHQEAYTLWERMHSEPGLELSLQAFTVMLRMCAQTREVERAFFYIDELRQRGIKPDAVAFTALFRACAGAPHWVNGYQNIVFDAMAIMEGQELAPTTEVYNAIIYAFGKAGDAAAAEFYFWEMQRKGLVPSLVTYCSLLDAYAESCSVGAKAYGSRGRYTPPARREFTKDEKAFASLGSSATTELMSRGLWEEGTLERGCRQRGKLQDLADDDPEGDEIALTEQVRFLASLKEKERERRSRSSRVAAGERNGSGSLMIQGTTSAFDGNDEDWSESEGSEKDTDVEAFISELPPDDQISLEELLSQDQDLKQDMDQGRRSEIGAGSARRVGRRRRGVNGREDLLTTSDPDIDSQAIIKGGGSSSSSGLEGLLSALEAAQRREEAKLQRLQHDDDDDDFADADIETETEEEAETASISGKGYGEEPQGAELWAAASRDVFMDPFVALRPERAEHSDAAGGSQRHSGALSDEAEGAVQAAALAQEQRAQQLQSVLGLLDGLGSGEESEGSRTNALLGVAGPAGAPARGVSGGSELETTATSSSPSASMRELASLGLGLGLSSQEEAWDLVEFGRAPDPDYSAMLPLRQAQLMRRAEMAFEHLSQGAARLGSLQPDATALTSLLSVYSESLKDRKALAVFDSFSARGLQPPHQAYRHLARMWVRKGDMEQALRVRDQMHAAGLRGDGAFYGILIEALARREALPESLKILEDCADGRFGVESGSKSRSVKAAAAGRDGSGSSTELGIPVRIPERFLRLLRARCTKLGVRHPDLPADPTQWVKDARKQQALASRAGTQHNRKVQQVKGWN